MNVRVKLIDIFRDYLPPGVAGASFRLDVQPQDSVGQIFSRLGIPDSLPRVVTCNGGIVQADRILKDGDVIAIFSPMFGG